MINTNTINNKEVKYEIILPNELGRKFTKRYKQYMYSDIEGEDGIQNWELQDFGCGPTSMATIISSLGYDIDPIEIAKTILQDNDGNPLDFYTNKNKGRLGLTTLSFIYLLQELVLSKKANLEYQLVKYSYAAPVQKKSQVTEMLASEYMALILVGPKGRINHPHTFSNYGHYIAVTSVNKTNNEFYVANPNKIGDSQIDTTYSYENLIANMYPNTFDFLMIRNKDKVLTKLKNQ